MRKVLLALLLAALPARAQEAKLRASDAASVDEFGAAVAVSGLTALVGAPRGLEPGSAYVFVRRLGGWTEQAILTPSMREVFDQFGAAVAIDGATAIVGAPFSGETGRVFIFEREGTAWAEVAAFDVADVAPGADLFGFGTSVAVSGDRALVGASAAAFALHRVAGEWRLDAELTSLGAFGGGELWNVAISGDEAVIGSAAVNVGGILDAGGAFTYRRGAAGWALTDALTASDPVENARFGAAVAISGDTVVVGAPDATGSGVADAGAAYIFRRRPGGWDQVLKAQPGVGAHAVHELGESVAVDGDVLAIGDGADPLRAVAAGSVHLYRRADGFWDLEDVFTASDAEAFDNYGRAVGLSTLALVAGAPNASELLFREGLAYAYGIGFVPPFLPHDPDRVISIILYGIVRGEGGVILIPGRGPVPIGPAPDFGQRFSPVFAVFYDDVAERDLLIEQVTLLWQQQFQAAPRVVRNPAEAVRSPDAFAIVVPDHEPAALVRLAAAQHRERTQPVVVMLREDGFTARVLRFLAAFARF